MKILRIVSAGYEKGGVENGIVLTNSILRANGHEVRVISCNERPDLEHYSNYEFSSVPSRGYKRLIYAAFNLSAFKVTKIALREFQPDVVLLHTMSQPTASVLFLLRRYPTIQFIHGPEIFTTEWLPWYLPNNAYKNGNFNVKELNLNGRMRLYYLKYVCAPLYKVAFHNVDMFVALSSFTLKTLQRQGIQAKYFPSGAKLWDSSPLPLKEHSLLFAGRLEKFKGVDDLLRAMPKILDEVPDCILYIAGDGSYRSNLEEMAKLLGVNKSVKFLGHLSQSELSNIYKKCTLFVMPSAWPETFGKVGIEAMSAGRPVIAADVGGVRDWLEDGINGLLVEAHQPEQLANKVVSLLKDKLLAEKMSRASVRTAQKFSIEKHAKNIESLILDITKK